MNAVDMLGVIVQDALLSAVAATGFAMLFSAPRRTLLGCAIGGALGHAIRSLLMQLGLEIELATLAGSVVIGVVGISAGVTLAPGVFAYQTMIGILQVAAGDPEAAAAALVAVSANGIKTALILGAIAVGIAAPTLLFDRRKPVV